VAEYGRLRDEGMGIEQAMIFMGYRFRMWHLRYSAAGKPKGLRLVEGEECLSQCFLKFDY
jgi:hypothetical protein